MDRYGGYHLGSEETYLPPRTARLREFYPEAGFAPYGIRHSGEAPKGSGYYGFIAAPEGYSTEISSEDQYGREYPLMVPTLSRAELDELVGKQGADISSRIYDKAEAWAEQRQAKGMSPFAEQVGIRYPLPEPSPIDELILKVKSAVDAAFGENKGGLR